jgi:hypothetical protein
MKTLNNLFGKCASVKSINEFADFSLNVIQMNSIKGGTEPIVPNPVKPIIPINGNI